jgi:hypothetical protein
LRSVSSWSRTGERGLSSCCQPVGGVILRVYLQKLSIQWGGGLSVVRMLIRVEVFRVSRGEWSERLSIKPFLKYSAWY